MASDHRVGGEEVMSKKQVILKDYVQWLSKRTKPVRTSRQVASIKLEAPEEVEKMLWWFTISACLVILSCVEACRKIYHLVNNLMF